MNPLSQLPDPNAPGYFIFPDDHAQNMIGLEVRWDAVDYTMGTGSGKVYHHSPGWGRRNHVAGCYVDIQQTSGANGPLVTPRKTAMYCKDIKPLREPAKTIRENW